MWKRREGKIFLALHACLLLLCLLFPLYVKATDRALSFLFGCFFHDYLFLYCPLCGGTRAISALLHLQFAEAIRYNVLVVGLVAFALILDIVVLIRLLRKKATVLKIPRRGWIVMICILVAFLILRNLLMIVWNFDPTGDLGAFWQNWKS